MFSACILSLPKEKYPLENVKLHSECVQVYACMCVGSVLAEGDFMINIPLERFSLSISVHACIISSNLKSKIRLQHFSNLIKKLLSIYKIIAISWAEFEFGLVKFEVSRWSNQKNIVIIGS